MTKLTLTRLLRLIAIGVLGTALAGCGSDRPTYPEDEADKITLQLPDAGGKRFDVFEEFKLSPGDMLDVLFQIDASREQSAFRIAVDNVLSVKFVHVPEFNEVQPVRPDGMISLPYLGQINVVGMTIDDLVTTLKQRYAGVLRDPDLYVVVTNYRARIDELKNDLHTASRGLSRLVTVRPDGYVTFPMIGHVMVAGRTLKDVNTELDDLYGIYLEGLEVDLFLEKHAGSLIYVLGQVNSPGGYEIRRPITVLEAVAMAGGFTNEVEHDSVMVIRREGETITAHRVNLTNVLAMKEASMTLQPDDVLFLPQTKLHHTADVMRAVMDVLMFRGWSVGTNWTLSDRAILNDQTR